MCGAVGDTRLFEMIFLIKVTDMRNFLNIWVIPTLSLIIISSNLILAQEISREVISIAGNEVSSGTVQLSWTVGEVSVGTLGDNGTKLSIGFHQTFDVNWLPELELSVYPNPFLDRLEIQSNRLVDGGRILIFNQAGQLLFREQASWIERYSLDLSRLASGMYFLKVISEGEHILRILKQ